MHLPNLYQEWHPTKNDKALDEYTRGSKHKAWWLCPSCGREWQTTIFRRNHFKSGCANCAFLARRKPHLDLLYLEWSPKNKGTLDDYVRTSEEKVHWVCELGHEWVASVFSRNTGTKCRMCSVRTEENTKHEQAVYQEWSSKNKTTPDLYTRGSSYMAHWVCPEGHEWRSTINGRNAGHGCKKCSARNPTNVKHLPHLYDEWDKEKNERALDEFTTGSEYTMHWVCPHNPDHKWEASIKKRNRGQGCFKCRRRGPENTKHAEHLYKEWSDRNETRLDDYTTRSGQTAWWVCQTCDEEWNTPIYVRGRGSGCPNCALSGTSESEKDLADFISGLGLDVERNVRGLNGSRLEYDIVIHDLRIAVEFNGLYWHSEKVKQGTDYHKRKTEGTEYQVIHVWEDDWRDRRQVVETMLKRKLGVSTERRVNARQTEFTEITAKQAREFLDEHHIQGYAHGGWYGALRQCGEIVAVMAMRKRDDDYELVRYATSAIVRGGHTKLLSEFKKVRNPRRIYTFSDNAVSDGSLYESCGFVKDKDLPPDYCYVVGGKRVHKFNYRKARFRKDPDLLYVEGKTERELALLNNLPRIWDAGKTRWVLYNRGDASKLKGNTT